MKHYIEIQKVRETDMKVDDTLTLPRNIDAFRCGDIISITEARVMKMFYKLVDEGLISERFDLTEMKIIAQNLPRRVYEDCVKEEIQILQKAGEHAGKLCNKVTMEIIKKRLGLV